MVESRYDLQDRGDQFVAFIRDAFGDDIAERISDEVAMARRSNGTLDTTLWKSGRGRGPMSLLGSWSGTARIGFEVWAQSGFGVFERRKRVTQAGEVLAGEGSDAAVDWVVANSTKGVPLITSLQTDWDDFVFTGDLNSDWCRGEAQRALLSWKR